MIFATSSFSKISVQLCVFKFLWFEERFRDGIVQKVSRTVETKLRFSNFSGVVLTGLYVNITTGYQNTSITDTVNMYLETNPPSKNQSLLYRY